MYEIMLIVKVLLIFIYCYVLFKKVVMYMYLSFLKFLKRFNIYFKIFEFICENFLGVLILMYY